MGSDVETNDLSNLPLKELLFPGDDGDLVNGEGVTVTSDVIDGKILGILVGPTWWKPLMLKNIIPSFADIVKEIVDKGNQFQMVFVPSQKDEELIEQLNQSERGEEIDSTSEEESFSSFMKAVPSGWLAVPPGNSMTIERLTEATQSTVIGLAFVTADGNIITTNGRELLIEWGADAFPFTAEHIKDLEKPFTLLKENPTLKGLLETEDRDYVVKNDGTQVKISSLQGPIAIYFSAHWCPPCRRFTPILTEVYNQLKDEGKHFEVVFVSWDRSEEDFNEYFGTMPWLALPFSDKGKKTLEKVYDVEGIPNLVILDSDGKIQQENAVGIIDEFKTAAYPFTNEKVEELNAQLEAEKEAARANQTLESLLVTEERDYVVDLEGNEVKVSSLVGKTVGLYFSAHWCPPCRHFTPKLVEIYKELKEADKAFEIIFISSDRDEEAFKEYYGAMPWLALPYNDRKLQRNTKQELGEYFEVKGIPCFIILGPDGKTVNRDGRSTMEKLGAKGFPFVKDDIDKKWDEEIKNRPVDLKIAEHEHPLKLMRVPYKTENYVCDICAASATRWAYRCDECGYDVDIGCIDKILADAAAKEVANTETKGAEDPETNVETKGAEDTETNVETKGAEDTETNGVAHKEGWICEGDVCRKA